jgi:endonuclease/exonuclease/phosphatase family metal-dependent hydrolase
MMHTVMSDYYYSKGGFKNMVTMKLWIVGSLLAWKWYLVSCIQLNHAKPSFVNSFNNINNINNISPTILLPGECFRDTDAGELSVVSLNILAPSYHWLGVEGNDNLIQQDRMYRVPMAIRMAKQLNADVLCLQEVEGGNAVLENSLREVLEETQNGIDGYDSYLWSALHPNRRGDVVGLCVAWRSMKHNLISPDCFRRGMVVQLEEIETGAVFCIGNVHLPAKPAAIEGRLKTMSTTIKSIASCASPRFLSALDGAAIVAGDFNSDSKSAAAKLLETGTAQYGTLLERNYKAKISKEAAYAMKHDFRFQDIYGNGIRQFAAPVTVALTGRGPGCMDHIYFASRQDKSWSLTNTHASEFVGKRKARRLNAQFKRAQDSQPQISSALSIDTVLATVDPNNPNRTQIIMDGLPNVPAGFPSDHVPIGVLLCPAPTSSSKVNNPTVDNRRDPKEYHRTGISANTRRRREAYTRSLYVRRRHNALLRAVTEWLISRGATHIIRDQPIGKWKWLLDMKSIADKLRAPDLCCVLNDALVIIEVTVANNPDAMRKIKLEKYRDLPELLQSAPTLTNMTVMETFVVLLDENGNLPDATQNDIIRLAQLSSTNTNADIDAKLFINHLQRIFLNVD